VGDDIMNVCVAGRFRTDVLPVFQELLTTIKTEIVREEEVSAACP
jgi:molybdopterin synthase catalytic subunit